MIYSFGHSFVCFFRRVSLSWRLKARIDSISWGEQSESNSSNSFLLMQTTEGTLGRRIESDETCSASTICTSVRTRGSLFPRSMALICEELRLVFSASSAWLIFTAIRASFMHCPISTEPVGCRFKTSPPQETNYMYDVLLLFYAQTL